MLLLLLPLTCFAQAAAAEDGEAPTASIVGLAIACLSLLLAGLSLCKSMQAEKNARLENLVESFLARLNKDDAIMVAANNIAVQAKDPMNTYFPLPDALDSHLPFAICWFSSANEWGSSIPQSDNNLEAFKRCRRLYENAIGHTLDQLAIVAKAVKGRQVRHHPRLSELIPTLGFIINQAPQFQRNASWQPVEALLDAVVHQNGNDERLAEYKAAWSSQKDKCHQCADDISKRFFLNTLLEYFKQMNPDFSGLEGGQLEAAQRRHAKAYGRSFDPPGQNAAALINVAREPGTNSSDPSFVVSELL
jgi:hypothetical protein